MDRPTIAEKVKFWQEQDRINQLVIPRVIRAHELIDELRKNVAETNDALAVTESRVTTTLRTEMTSIRSDVRSVQARVDANDDAIAAVRKDLIAAEGRLSKKLDDQIGKVEADTKDLRSKAVVLRTDMDGARGDIRALQTRVDRNDAAIDRAKAELVVVEKRLSKALDDQLGEVRTDIGGLQSKSTELGGAIEVVGRDLKSAEARVVTQLNDGLSVVRESIIGLDARLGATEQDIKAAGSEIEVLKAQAIQLGRLGDELRSQLGVVIGYRKKFLWLACVSVGALLLAVTAVIKGLL